MQKVIEGEIVKVKAYSSGHGIRLKVTLKDYNISNCLGETKTGLTTTDYSLLRGKKVQITEVEK